MMAVGGPRAYVDFNATAPLRPQARAAMIEALGQFGNPSSVHGEGRRARAIVEAARREVAALVGAQARSVIFTSGASEANATVIAQPRWAAIAVSAVEHPSVIEPARRRGDVLSELPVDADGQLDLVVLRAWLARPCAGDRLVSVQWANSETGVVQPIREIADLVVDHGAILHVDAVQAAGRLPIDMERETIGLLTLSSHKIGGPQGVGAIVQGRGGELRFPLIAGGGQEYRLRAGTENVAGCAGFGAAAGAALEEAASGARLGALRDELEAAICALSPQAVVIGGRGPRLANTSAIALPGSKAETMLIAFDMAGVAISAGSACSSGKVGRSHVLEAMGVAAADAMAALRFSFGWASTQADVARCLSAWELVIKRKATAAVAAA